MDIGEVTDPNSSEPWDQSRSSKRGIRRKIYSPHRNDHCSRWHSTERIVVIAFDSIEKAKAWMRLLHRKK